MKTIDSKQFNLNSEQILALGNGETLVLTQRDEPLAYVISAMPPASKRPFGLAGGEFTVSEDFNDPIPEVETDFYES